jgi:hypothetical protein
MSGPPPDRADQRARATAGRLRRWLRSMLLGPEFADRMRIDQAAILELRKDLDTLAARLDGHREKAAPVLEWMQGAERHLAALQEAHDRQTVADPEPVLAWMRSAEAHLVALQQAYDDLHELHHLRTRQLEELITTDVALDGRVAELEAIATDLVADRTRSRIHEQLQ